MIPEDTFVVYAQYNEDIILGTLLEYVKKGFYVDVGANHEEYHSVTKYFYKKGWNGINIEPIPRLAKEISKNRKRDIVLNCAVATKKGEMNFREYPNQDGLSTLSKESQKANEELGLSYKDYTIQVNTLNNIFKENNVNEIDFMKVDVEGYEADVLKSNDWQKYRPKVICIESNHRLADWRKHLEDEGYLLVIFDGLNEYYLSQEAKSLFDKFAERAAVSAHNALRKHHYEPWKKDIKHIDELQGHVKRLDRIIHDQDTIIKNLNAKLREVQIYSLKNRSLLSRIKVSILGLTKDFYEQEKQKRTKK